MKAKDCSPLVELTRGELNESIHFGAFVVVDSSGRILPHEGNPDLLTYPRSSMKPFQALPFIESKGAQAYDFSSQEIAIMCASHSGTNLHRQVLESMHQKIGTHEADLACGVHWPGDEKTRLAMEMAGETPTPFRHNCSGKHTGMLAYARLNGWPIEDYLNPQHPVQIRIREVLADMVDMNPDEMPLGIDGCSAPVYGIPLNKMAMAIAKMADPVALEANRAIACRKITSAMRSHPDMVAGPGKFDTVLMSVAGVSVFSKGGAEGYQVIGIMPGAINTGSPGIGIAIKIADGDALARARTAIGLRLLEAFGILNREKLENLQPFGFGPVLNWRKLVVGEMRPAFTITHLEKISH